MAQKKYVSLSKLSTFLDNLKDTFANLTHIHKLSDITDYKVDTSLSPTSTNPVQNKVIDAEFEAMATAMNALDTAIDGKANTSHTHNISDVTNLQSSLNGKVPTSRTINSKPLSANITLSASDVGAAPSSHSHNDVYYTEAEVDEKIDNALNEAKVNASNKDAVVLAEAQKGINNVQTSIDTHASNTAAHVSSTERTNWNAAHTHSISTHARVDATKVEDSATNGNIKINGTETNVYSHPNSSVSAGTYKSVTVNAQGHITAGSNPTTLAGYGITDAETKGAASSALTSAKEYTDTVASGKSDKTHNHDSAYDAKGAADTAANSALASAKSYTDTKVSGLTSTTVVDNKISTHNTSTSAHNDIRELISGLTTRLNTLANSDDTTLDQMSEVVAYIKNNKSLIDGITTSKVNVSDIVNNLTTNVTNKPLSAAQGVAIKGLIDALQEELDSHTHAIADVTGLQSALDGKAASSHGTHVSFDSTNKPKMNGTAAFGTSSKVARADHVHPTDTSRASQADLESLETALATAIEEVKANASNKDAVVLAEAQKNSNVVQSNLDTHDSNTTKHITSTERTNWNAAKTHADSAHAPSNAEKNQNAFSNIKVGSTTIAADTTTDTLELVGSNVTITPDATNDKVTIAVATGSTSTAGILKLTNSTSSTSTTTAATPNSVKSAYDLANTAKTNAATAQTRADSAYTLAESKVDSLSDLGVTVTATELNYVDGVKSNIQTQLDELQNDIDAIPQSDWNQNDSTKLDFVKNRPFYTTDPVDTTIAEGTIPANGMMQTSASMNFLTLGETYKAVFDGTTYNNLVCENYDGLPSIGNNAFMFTIQSGRAMAYAANGSASHTLKVIGSISMVVPLERKYIAEHIDNFAGEKVAGKTYTVDGAQVTAGKCAEVFNDYDTNIASGQYSHAEGMKNIASGSTSHAEGYNVKASGSYSHAEGYETTASASRSHAEGWVTEAAAQGAHAEGFATHATGQFSHAEGDNATAAGRASHAEGYGTEAIADYSHAEGMNTNASSEYQHVQGKYNVIDEADTYAHIVGNGTGNSSRKNAHTIDWSGNANFAGDVYVGNANTNKSGKKLATEEYVSNAVKAIDFPVDSVNGKTGAVTLSASDVGAAPASHIHSDSHSNVKMPVSTPADVDWVLNAHYDEMSDGSTRLIQINDTTGNAFNGGSWLVTIGRIDAGYGYAIAHRYDYGSIGVVTLERSRYNGVWDSWVHASSQHFSRVGHTHSASEIGAQSALGYTPVRQGTGHRQNQNAVVLGWTGSRLALTVDATDCGDIYTTYTPPSAAEVGALPTSGGTMTGHIDMGWHSIDNLGWLHCVSGYTYGTSLPAAGNAGRIFFKKV